MKNKIDIPLDNITLEGILTIPEKATAIVIFVHGSGSSRYSPRNNFVAEVLQKAGFATLLFDLLTEAEDEIYGNRFNIDLLTERLISVTKWLLAQANTKKLKIGYFGASTGAAAAIKAAAKLGATIKTIVSRGGRPDLAGEALAQIQSSTLLIVGGNDFDVLQLNQQAGQLIKAKKEITIISGATHLFEEPGTLEQVANVATRWFKQEIYGI
jgi:predicted alpha/beta-hydrolase family hydrolase